MLNSIEVVKSTATVASEGTSGGAGQVTAYSEPHMQISSPAGVAASTPANAIFAAGNTSSFTAGQDINFAAQGNTHHAVKGGISLFTYGKATNASKPNQETGIKLHAASGKVTSQSQSDETRLTADKSITVASITQSVTVAAPKHVLLTAGGAYIKIEGGNIEIHGPGTMAFNAGMKTLTGGKSESLTLPTFTNSTLSLNTFERHTYAAQYQVFEGENLVPNQPYVLTLPNGTKHYSTTNTEGKTLKVGTSESKDLKLTLLEKDDWIQENINVWHQEMDKHWG